MVSDRESPALAWLFSPRGERTEDRARILQGQGQGVDKVRGQRSTNKGQTS